MKNKGKLLILFGFVLIIGIYLFFYFNSTESVEKINKDITLVEKNYNSEFHHLALNSQNLGKMPDLCGMLEGTKYINDIWSIDLSNNSIEKIDQDLSCFFNLSELNLAFNNISTIENLEKLTFLKKLDLGNNKIIQIENLAKLQLQDLHLGYNQIISTDGLQKLLSLKKLKLQHNSITDISYLEKLMNLEELKLEFNNLDNNDIQVLKNLKNLKVITIAENKGVNQSTIDSLNAFSLKNSSSTGSIK